jgi:hypothetical protein
VAIGCLLQTLGGKKKKEEIVCHLHLILCKVQTQRNVCSLVNYYGLSNNRVYLPVLFNLGED